MWATILFLCYFCPWINTQGVGGRSQGIRRGILGFWVLVISTLSRQSLWPTIIILLWIKTTKQTTQGTTSQGRLV